MAQSETTANGRIELKDACDVNVEYTHSNVRKAKLGIETVVEDMLPRIDAEAEWSQADLENLSKRIEEIRESLYDECDALTEAELALEADDD